MALVEKSHGASVTAFPFGSRVGTSGRIRKAASFLTVFGFVFFALGFAFGHGYWAVALWLAAAALAWVFMRGASEASLPSEGLRDD